MRSVVEAGAGSSDPPARLDLNPIPAPNGLPGSDHSHSASADEAGRRLGVPTTTVLSWERHHGLDLDHSIDGSQRRQSLADLEPMRDQVVAARTTVTAAAMVNARLTATPTQLCGALLAATHHLDAIKIIEVLSRSKWLHGVPATIDDVVLPALREIGNRWSRGGCDVAQEHLATTTIENWLHSQSQAARPLSPAAVVVLSCGPTEQHTLGLAALAVLLAHHGLASINLGARTPATTLRTAIHDAQASAMVLTSHMNANRRATVAALRTAKDTSAVLYYAGAAFRTSASRRGVPGTYLGGSLTNAATQLATQFGF